jgi:glycosyltransferase involved in cell wall biosynthesis
MRMKTQLPPVSYFIPAYNCAQTIVESVESLFHGNFLEGDELIITNDGSSDNTPEILIHLKEKYPFKHLKFISSSKFEFINNSNEHLVFKSVFICASS